MSRKLNDLERSLMVKMLNLTSFRKYAQELLIELIIHEKIRPRSIDEINHICEAIYEELCTAEEQENKKQNAH